MASIEFMNLLRETIGLDTASVGFPAIERSLQSRMTACKLGNEQEYLEYLRADKRELQELVETVVVPETWFFRDREAFTATTRMVRDEWMPAHPEGVLRLLSLPCSTGEEPYSAAIALLDAGLPAQRFKIDAIDISSRALRHAQRAVYGKNSFRGNDNGFRDRHFEALAQGYRPSEEVRRQVHFQHGNIFDTDFLSKTALYDVIYCRNLLIYFDSATQKHAIQILGGMLATKGALFLGPSETSLAPRDNFVSMKVPMAFGFRKVVNAGCAPKPEKVTPFSKSSRNKHITTQSKMFGVHRASVVVHRPLPPAPKISSLEEAQRLADKGMLVQAAKYCENHIRSEGSSPQAYYLLGLILDATDKRSRAVDAYRKAIYLDPNHYEALIHLALLLESQDDAAGAKALNVRAQRLQQKRRESNE